MAFLKDTMGAVALGLLIGIVLPVCFCVHVLLGTVILITVVSFGLYWYLHEEIHAFVDFYTSDKNLW